MVPLIAAMHRCLGDGRRTAFVCLRQETQVLRQIRGYLEPFRGRTRADFRKQTVVAGHMTHAGAYTAAVHPRFTVMASSGAGRTTRIVDTRTWTPIQTINHGYRSLAFHPTRPLLVIGGESSARIYDFSSGRFKLSRTLCLTPEGYTQHYVRFVPGLNLLCVWARWKVIFFRVEDWGRLLCNNCQVHNTGGPYLGYKPTIVFHPTGSPFPFMLRRWRDRATLSYLCLTKEREKIRVFDVQQFTIPSMMHPLGHRVRGHVLSVGLGKDHLAIGYARPISLGSEKLKSKQEVRLYRIKDVTDFTTGMWKPVTYETPSKLLHPVINSVPLARVSGVLDVSVNFHPSQPILAVSCHRHLQLFDVNSGKILQTLNGHSATINRVVFHPVLPLLITAASDKRRKVCVFNLSPDAPPYSTPHKKGFWSPQEVVTLMAAVQRQKTKRNWSEIAQQVHGRTAQQCSSAYYHRIKKKKCELRK